MNASASRLCARGSHIGCFILLAASLAWSADTSAQSGTWTLADSPRPSPRMYFSSIYDAPRDRMLIFGGHPQLLSDLWEYSLTSGTWTQLGPTGGPPAARWGHTAIHDPSRDRLVVFGGFDGTELNDTWILDLASHTWSQAATGGLTPSLRRNHTAIYDAANDRMVVFGGYDGEVFRNDAQALSFGTMTWSDIETHGPTPEVRDLMTAVYDPNDQRMVVFGGWSGEEYLNDVWMLSLDSRPRWEKIQRLRTPKSTNPGPRRDYVAVYDPIEDRMVLFGGTNGDFLNDVWVLTLGGGEMWTPQTTGGAGPSGRNGGGAIFDPSRNELVVFGGYDTNWRADVHHLSLTTKQWSGGLESNPPSPRRDYASALDAGGDRVLYFGGTVALNESQGLNVADLWTRSLDPQGEWTLLDAGMGAGMGSKPGARHGSSAFFDVQSGGFYVFGGYGVGNGPGQNWLNDLWRWDSSTGWSPVAVSGPPPSIRMYTSIVYDAGRDGYVLFGGHPNYLNDVWVLQLRPSPQWTQMTPSGTPPSPRFNHAAVMDDTNDRMIVHGGIGSSGEVGDTWALNFSGAGGTWQQISAGGAVPGPRRVMGSTVDTARDRMLIFGGFNGSSFLNSTAAFSFASNTWTLLTPPGTAPAERDLMSIHYDASRDQVILFGGFSPLGYYNDTWFLGGFGAPQPFSILRGPSAQLSLRAQNPVRSASLQFTLDLPAAGAAELELIDISGRRVARQAFGHLSAGQHQIQLGAVHARPGIYFARIAHNGAVTTTRVAVIQ